MKERLDKGGKEYYPATAAIIARLGIDPTEPFECSHGGEPAAGIYEVPKGCVALPGLETQALCPQHVLTDGSFEGMHLVVDLSVNAEWSRRCEVEPDYCILADPESGALALHQYRDIQQAQ